MKTGIKALDVTVVWCNCENPSNRLFSATIAMAIGKKREENKALKFSIEPYTEYKKLEIRYYCTDCGGLSHVGSSKHLA